MTKVDELKMQLEPGRIYRTKELAKWSNAVDRHIKQLVRNMDLNKISNGIYYCPRESKFGQVPPEEGLLLKAILKGDDFLQISLNNYNALGLGLTQLYNLRLVYNHKLNGTKIYGKRKFCFIKGRKFPKKIDEYFLIVDLINNIKMLAENENELKAKVLKKISTMDSKKMLVAANKYGFETTKTFFRQALEEYYVSA